MAKSILKEFYYGNITPVERQIINISEIRRAAKELDVVENQLRAILQPEAIPLMERYGKVQAELASLTEADSYVNGFRTGARFMLEILDDSPESIVPIISDEGKL